MFMVLNPYMAVLDVGPVQMSIRAERKGQPLGREWRKLEQLVSDWLGDLKRYLEEACKPWTQVKDTSHCPKVFRLMHDAVRSTSEPTLTSMAAVAGTISEMVCNYLTERGATKVLVNNGGDIAVHLGDGESTRVGIIPRLGAQPSHYVQLSSASAIKGIATSGFGGRSFTRGIADAAVALAAKPSIADACATVLANAVNVESPLIERRQARELDPATDIPNLWVTTKILPLPGETRDCALANGMEKAREMVDSKLLFGAILFLAGKMVEYPQGITRNL